MTAQLLCNMPLAGGVPCEIALESDDLKAKMRQQDRQSSPTRSDFDDARGVDGISGRDLCRDGELIAFQRRVLSELRPVKLVQLLAADLALPPRPVHLQQLGRDPCCDSINGLARVIGMVLIGCVAPREGDRTVVRRLVAPDWVLTSIENSEPIHDFIGGL